MRRTIAIWTVLAVLGVALAAGLAIAATHIVSQHIGLSSEPGHAGDRLVAPGSRPAEPDRDDRSGGHGGDD